MTRIFYSKYVPEGSADPGPLFANMSPDHAERVAAAWREVFGGPFPITTTNMVDMPEWSSQHLGKG